MKTLRKTNIAIGIILLLIVSLTVGGIAAYLTSSDVADNSFRVGGVNVDIIEKHVPPPEIKPGTSFTKDVSIENKGPTDCYVRVKAVFTDDSMSDYCTVDWNLDDWVYNQDDGYYYYKDNVLVGDSTTSLFTTVTVSNSIPENEIKDFDILVYAEAYQSVGYDAYWKAWKLDDEVPLPAA